MIVGKYTYGIKNIKTYYNNEKANLKIGNFCSISSNINIVLGGNHRNEITPLLCSNDFDKLFEFFKNKNVK